MCLFCWWSRLLQLSAHILPPFRSPPHESPFFFPPPPLALRPATAAQGVTHLLMRAAIDFSLTPQPWEGGQTGWSQPLRKTICQRRAGGLVCVTTQLQKAHSGIIFTLLLYFPNTPPREGAERWKKESEEWGKEKEKEKEIHGLWMYICTCICWVNGWPVTRRVGLDVCENTPGRHFFLHRWGEVFHPERKKTSLLTSPAPVITNSDLYPRSRACWPAEPLPVDA